MPGSPLCTYIVASNDTVYKLQNADQDEEGHKGIDQLRSLRRSVQIILPDAQSDLLRALVRTSLGRSRLYNRRGGIGSRGRRLSRGRCRRRRGLNLCTLWRHFGRGLGGIDGEMELTLGMGTGVSRPRSLMELRREREKRCRGAADDQLHSVGKLE
jgi:hypothetical protein